MTLPRLAACGLMAALTAPAHGQAPEYLDTPLPIPAAGDYVHDGSGMVFPVAVGPWQRIELQRFDRDALDVAGSYWLTQPDGGAVATFYVAPLPIPEGGPAARDAACHEQFAVYRDEVVRRNRARLLTEAKVPAPGGSAFDDGFQATFRYAGNGGDTVMQLSLFCFVGGPWAFEYRISQSAEELLPKAVAVLMNGLVWTVPPGP